MPFTDPAEQTASLVALTAVIKASPRATFVHEIPTVSALPISFRTSFCINLPYTCQQLIPFLLRGLELKDADIRANVIDTFIAAAEGETEEKSIVAEHSTALVILMLKNSKVEEMPVVVSRDHHFFLASCSIILLYWSQRVRISALKYLALLPGLVRYDILHPCKPIVLRELANVLDDPKRPVRKEAVDARYVSIVSLLLPKHLVIMLSRTKW